MSYDRFPQLRGTRLRSLSLKTIGEYAPEIVKLATKVLEELGPLPAAGLRYFINKHFDLHLAEEDITTAISWAGEDYITDYSTAARHDGCYRTLTQHEKQTPPSVPTPDDYQTAYYQMYERLELAKKDPRTITIPVDMLRQTGLI